MATRNRVAPSKNGESDWSLDAPSTADQLLEQFGRIEQAWKKAEDALAATRCPVDVRVKVDSGNIGDEASPFGSYDCFLEYCRVKGARKICYTIEREFYNCHPDQAVEVERKPIIEMPVDDRLEMFDQFPKLLAQAEAAAKSYVPKIRERVDRFEAELDRNLLF